MALLLGQYVHNMDPKNRLFIPSAIRDELGQRFVLCTPPNGEKCLFGYAVEDWKELAAIINSQPTGRELTLRQRFTYLNVDTVTHDAQGRITIKNSFCEYAGLEREVFILGVGRRVEIWDLSAWNNMLDAAKADNQFPAYDFPF